MLSILLTTLAMAADPPPQASVTPSSSSAEAAPVSTLSKITSEVTESLPLVGNGHVNVGFTGGGNPRQISGITWIETRGKNDSGADLVAFGTVYHETNVTGWTRASYHVDILGQGPLDLTIGGFGAAVVHASDEVMSSRVVIQGGGGPAVGVGFHPGRLDLGTKILVGYLGGERPIYTEVDTRLGYRVLGPLQLSLVHKTVTHQEKILSSLTGLGIALTF